MTERDPGRYPGYDVMAKQHGLSWDDVTRRAVARRLAFSGPRFFTPSEFETLEAVADRIMPQPSTRPKVPCAALVDAKIAERHEDGYRLASMPQQGEAWRRGLAALDAEAVAAHGARFRLLEPAQQDVLLTAMQKGELSHAAWAGMPPKDFFAHRLIADITHGYYGHPTAWNEIGYGGPASPRGYVRMGLDRRDPWEAAEAKPGQEAQARALNRRVR